MITCLSFENGIFNTISRVKWVFLSKVINCAVTSMMSKDVNTTDLETLMFTPTLQTKCFNHMSV